MTVNDMVQLLGKKIGIEELALDPLGLCQIQINHTLKIVFEEDDSQQWLHVYAPVHDDGTVLAKKTLLELFRAHFVFGAVANACFGLDNDDRLCLFMRIPVPGISEERLTEMFGSFIGDALDWQEKLAELDDSSREDASEQKTEMDGVTGNADSFRMNEGLLRI